MFGFSLPKLIFTIVAVLVVWYGFKWFNRMQMSGPKDTDRVRSGGRTKPRAESRSATGVDDGGDTEEMIKCQICETYVSAKSAVNCGRNGCPYPG